MILRHVCPDCGEDFFNEFAHAEMCMGGGIVQEWPIVPKFSDALVREMIAELDETVRHLEYELAVARTRRAWLRAVQRGTIKP